MAKSSSICPDWLKALKTKVVMKQPKSGKITKLHSGQSSFSFIHLTFCSFSVRSSPSKLSRWFVRVGGTRRSKNHKKKKKRKKVNERVWNDHMNELKWKGPRRCIEETRRGIRRGTRALRRRKLRPSCRGQPRTRGGDRKRKCPFERRRGCSKRAHWSPRGPTTRRKITGINSNDKPLRLAARSNHCQTSRRRVA